MAWEGWKKGRQKEGSTKAEPASWCRNNNNWSLITFELMNGPTIKYESNVIKVTPHWLLCSGSNGCVCGQC